MESKGSYMALKNLFVCVLYCVCKHMGSVKALLLLKIDLNGKLLKMCLIGLIYTRGSYLKISLALIHSYQLLTEPLWNL